MLRVAKDDKHGLDDTVIYVPLSHHQRTHLVKLLQAEVEQTKSAFSTRLLMKLAQTFTPPEPD